jgi:short-subunit dehydrogenase
VVGMDLSIKDAPQVLYYLVKEMGHTVEVLINNAGYGMYGAFVELPWERQRNMLELDIITLVHMTQLFVKDMVARNSGYILQISSIGAYQPSPTYATYAAAKSLVLNFGEALNYELRNTKVKVSVLCPGATATEFFQVSGHKPPLSARLTMMRSRKVAEIGIKTMLKGKMSKVPGFPNSFMAWSTRLVPRRWTAAIANLLMEGDKK